MLAALARYMPEEVSWTKPKGGFYIWVTLPEGMDAVELPNRERNSVDLEALAAFTAKVLWVLCLCERRKKFVSK